MVEGVSVEEELGLSSDEGYVLMKDQQRRRV